MMANPIELVLYYALPKIRGRELNHCQDESVFSPGICTLLNVWPAVLSLLHPGFYRLPCLLCAFPIPWLLLA